MVVQTVDGMSASRAERIFTGPFVTLLLSNGLLRMCTYMFITLVPLYALHRGMSPAGAGLTTTLYMGAAVLTRPIAGRLVDKRGRWMIILAGSSLFFVAAGFFLLALPIWLFLADRALQGIGFSLNGTAVMTLATDMIPESRMAQGISYLGIEQTVAQIISPWLILTVLASSGYEVAFALVFALSALNLLVRFPLARTARRLEADRKAAAALEATTPSTPAPRTSFWSRIIERNAWRPALVMCFVMLGTTTINTFLAAWSLQRGIENAGLFFTCSGAALAAARFAVPTIARRIEQTKLIAPAMVFVIVGLLLVAWTPNLLVLALAGVAYGLGMGVVTPGLNALAVLAADRRSRGLANSTFFMAMDLANAVGAPLLGVAAGFAGLGSVFVVGAGFLVVAIITLAVVQGRAARTV